MDGSPPPPSIQISPPLLNSANPWATTLEDLKTLFECPSTGAVTTRTSLLHGFPHDPSVHQYTFFDPSKHDSPPPSTTTTTDGDGPSAGRPGSGSDVHTRYSASLNTLGYSPIPLDEYLSFIRTIASSSAPRAEPKYFIVSVTGTPDEVAECYRRVARLQQEAAVAAANVKLAVEVNLSCPNIPGKPPPAYSGDALAPYLAKLRDAAGPVPWGLKTPPYTYADQFETLVGALGGAAAGAQKRSPASFLTATNTLGSSLVLDSSSSSPSSPSTGGKPKPRPRLAGGTGLAGPGPGIEGIGGMAGAPLHPLALGNVATLRRLLDAREETRHVAVIGVGGVEDAAGYRRMRDVGAAAVGVGTALGRKGVAVFGEIEGGVGAGAGAGVGLW